MSDREKTIVRTSVIGIVANIFLAGFKAVVGLLSNSIAVILDAVNNLSDALSSVITIIGTKLAGKKADKKHPLGYGRIEYLSGSIVAAIVLYAGITSAVESVKKIISPETPDYSVIALVIISSAVLVKLLLGLYVRKKGNDVNSSALKASGSDALFDAVLSLSVLVSAIIFIIWGISLEAYVGVIIAVVIIKAGIEMLMESIDDILGKRVDIETKKKIRDTVCEEEEVMGAYDLILHNYGPDRYVASVHVEIKDTLSAEEIDKLERRIADNVFKKHGVIVAAVGIYSVNTTDDLIISLRSDATRIVMSHEGVLQMHGFHVDNEKKQVYMDVILDYDIEDRKDIFIKIGEELYAAHPEYKWMVTPDIDI